MKELQILTDAPFTKVEQVEFSQAVITEILSGTINPLQADLRLKALEEVIKKIRENKDVKDYVMDECSKYGGKSFETFGAKITITGRTTKDYSACGDFIWKDLNGQLEALKNQIKAREAMLDTGINIETGETFKAPMEKRTEFLKVEFL